MSIDTKIPDFIFETSWEVCNKVGGIHTVLSTKAQLLQQKMGDNVIYFGPDFNNDEFRAKEFTEDNDLYKYWREQANLKGLSVRVGRWKIPGNPIAILVDFKAYYGDKNFVFAKLWENYGVDSLRGDDCYNDSAVFGYAVGKVIVDFTAYNLKNKLNIVAMFHEWMSGAGCLYLKDHASNIATIFTTHATMMGRVLASNNEDLYDNLKYFNANEKMQQYNVTAPCSLEHKAALNAHCLSTVSHITANECLHFYNRNVDVLLPNGFGEDFIPEPQKLKEKAAVAKSDLKKVAESLLGYRLQGDTMIIGTGGRYEFKNKGLDVFLGALSQLNNSDCKREVLAFFFIPADQRGARPDLQDALKSEELNRLDLPFVTHKMGNIDSDAILGTIRHFGFTNEENQKVKVIFIPTYLNGNDGIFNKSYYDLLMGLDLSVFPSYYEPWGYTPMESVAFSVPTVTTSLAGFGKWVEQINQANKGGVQVIERTDSNTYEVVTALAKYIADYAAKNREEILQCRNNAWEIAEKTLWNNFIDNYYKSYNIALKNRKEQKMESINREKQLRISKSNSMSWRKLVVESELPESLKGLEELSKNLWWCWSYEAKGLFKSIEPALWKKSEKNPIVLLKRVSPSRLIELSKDAEFMARYEKVYNEFKTYMSQKPAKKEPKIAYFSMEYGLNNNLKIYSGGLGILAGDYLKEASDSLVDMVAVGFMYQFGYFTQRMSLNGEQLVELDAQKFTQLPIALVREESGLPVKIKINIEGRDVFAKIWRVDVGRVPLFLLDTETNSNAEQDKVLTHQLYGGDWDNRIKQEILLGMGGIKALKELNIDADLYHCNEGHAALINVERLINLIKDGYQYEEALEIVRASSLFTTHTPVPAGHDTFDPGMIRHYLYYVPEQLQVGWDDFLALGRVNPLDQNEKFSMSNLAANTSIEMNGVSMLHGKVSQEMFNNLYSGYFPQELHIGYVTNGVHYPTWTAKEWRKLHEKNFKKGFINDLSNPEYWEKIYDVDDSEIWSTKNKLRKKLIDYAKFRFQENWIRRYEDPSRMVDILNSIDDKTLTIGFARRFATYKRAHLLFSDLDRLSKLLNNPERPVQFLFAGKAHPADKAGQDLIKRIIEVSRRPEFVGKILFLENYDMELGKRLVKGVDIWMNTPTRPLEASGTSGEKAVMNGVLNFSVLDGWWLEGYRKGAGWALTEKRTYENQAFQDELDAQTIYSMFENEIIPLFYDRNKDGVPEKWVQYIKNCIAQIAPHYTTKRMMDDYKERYYYPMYKRVEAIKPNNYQVAKDVAAWKKEVLAGWEQIEVVAVDTPSTLKKKYQSGEKYHIEVTLDLKELINTDIRVEMVLRSVINGEESKIISFDVPCVKSEGTLAFYHHDLELENPGIFDFGLRIYPHNENIPHRQDFNYVRWI